MLNPTPRLQSRRRRAFTLVEVNIASVIMLLSAVMAMSAIVYAIRITKAQRTTLSFISQTIKFERIMKQYANSAAQIITNNGSTLTIIQPDGTQGRMNFVDGDADPATLDNNKMVWTPNTAGNGGGRAVLSNLYPVDAATPIFTLMAASPDSVPGGYVLRVRFRMGDHATPTAKDQGYTGINFQAYTFDAIFTPRNTSAS